MSFNKDLIIENFGDDKDILNELVEMFFNELPNMIAPIEKSINENNSAELHLHAHTLKGAVSNFFAEKCVAISFELEQMGKSGELNIDLARSLLSNLNAELEVLSKDLNGFIS